MWEEGSVKGFTNFMIELNFFVLQCALIESCELGKIIGSLN